MSPLKVEDLSEGFFFPAAGGSYLVVGTESDLPGSGTIGTVEGPHTAGLGAAFR